MTENEGMKLRSCDKDGTVQEFVIREGDGQIEETSSNQVYFAERDEPIVMKSEEEALKPRNDLQKISSYREEVITKQILIYFEETHRSLCEKVFAEGEKAKL